MSSLDDDTTNTIDINVPTDTEGHPLNWDGNPAKILGLLDETSKHDGSGVVLLVLGAVLLTSQVSRIRFSYTGNRVARTVPFL